MRGQYGNSIERIGERIEANLLFFLTFVTLVAAALVSLLLPWTWSRRLSAHEQKWFLARLWDEAGTFVEFALMG
jgi:hypothetical protein